GMAEEAARAEQLERGAVNRLQDFLRPDVARLRHQCDGDEMLAAELLADLSVDDDVGVVGRELRLGVELDGELAHAGGEQRGEDHRYDQHQPGSSHDEVSVATQEWEHADSSW